MRVGQFEALAHQVDAELQPLFAQRAAMRAAENSGIDLIGAPARRLGAGTGREMRARRAQFGLGPVRGRTGWWRGLGHKKLSSQRARAALGRRGPPQALAGNFEERNGGKRFGDEMTNRGGFLPFVAKFALKS